MFLWRQDLFSFENTLFITPNDGQMSEVGF
jgi:hypothetical protein